MEQAYGAVKVTRSTTGCMATQQSHLLVRSEILTSIIIYKPVSDSYLPPSGPYEVYHFSGDDEKFKTEVTVDLQGF